MSKQKYVYNTQSLKFEKYRPSVKQTILKASGYLFAIVFTGFVLFILADMFLPSQHERALKRELEQMRYNYAVVTDKVNSMNNNLENIHDRDINLHRFILGMDPIDSDVWSAGIGGSDRYKNLAAYPNSAELLISTQMKVDKLATKLDIQLESLSELEKEAAKREDMLLSIPSIKPVREDLLKRNISSLSGFGIRLHPVHKINKLHTGIDFTAPTGSDIQATGNGKVVSVKKSRFGYGNNVVIDHGYGYKSLYGHMSIIDVRVGDEVTKGQKIGEVGNTGTSTAPHLHYEVRHHDKPVDPIIYVMDDLSPEEYQILSERAAIENQSFD